MLSLPVLSSGHVLPVKSHHGIVSHLCLPGQIAGFGDMPPTVAVASAP